MLPGDVAAKPRSNKRMSFLLSGFNYFVCVCAFDSGCIVRSHGKIICAENEVVDEVSCNITDIYYRSIVS